MLWIPHIRRVVAVFATALGTCLAYAGPFGYEAGMTLERARAISKRTYVDKDRLSLSVLTPPIPHPYLQTYSLTFSKTGGLCRILALGGAMFSHAYTSKQLDELFAALETKYGKANVESVNIDNARLFESLKSDGPGRWIARWQASTRKPLPENLESVSMSLTTGLGSGGIMPPLSTDIPTAYFTLLYDFKTNAACEKERRASIQKPL